MTDDFTVVADDGTRLAATLHGAAEAPRRTVLIHSLAMTRAFWDDVVARLEAPDLAILTFDCRGHGASGKPPGPYRIERFARDVIGLMDHLDWRDAAVAGCSMGGSVALATAVQHPARVSGLALIDTTASYGPDAPEAWNKRAQTALNDGLDSLVAFQSTRWFSDAFRSTHPEKLEAALAHFLANDRDSYAAVCRMLGSFDVERDLGTIRVPVSILVGEEDYATPVAMARTLEHGIAGSSLEILPGARHLSPLERPDDVARVIAALLQKVVSRD